MSRILSAAAGLAVLLGTTSLAQDASKSAPAKTPAVIPPSPAAADAKANPQPQSIAQPKAPAPAPQATPDPNALAAAEVRDWPGLAKRLEVMGEAELLPTAALWKGFTADAKAAAKRMARAASADLSDQRVVLNSINAWIEGRNSAADAALKSEHVRDVELQSLLKKPVLGATEVNRRNRLLIELMFPIEVAQRPAPTGPDGAVVSRYPPNRLSEVTLSLSVPGLRGRVNVFLPDDKTLTIRGNQPATIMVPNDGTLRYAITGDEYDRPFPRQVTWNPDEVKGGVVERTLPLLRPR